MRLALLPFVFVVGCTAIPDVTFVLDGASHDDREGGAPTLDGAYVDNNATVDAAHEGGDDAASRPGTDAGAAGDVDASPLPLPCSGVARPDPSAVCCGTSWCQGSDCSSPAFCVACEAAACASHLCTEPGHSGKIKCG